MMKKWLVLLFGVFTYVVGIGIYFTNRLMFMRKKEDEFVRNREITAKRVNETEFHKLPKTKVMVASPFGYDLDCYFIHPYNTKKWVIFCHGITENKWNSIKYMNLFIERGFNSIIYDHRRHGGSGGRTSSYGYYEKWDLDAVIKELKKREGEDVKFGIHGESMGAVTAILYGGTIDDAASFYIVDCPFSDFTEQLKYRIKQEIKIPSWLVLPIGKYFLKMRDGYWMKDVSPQSVISNIQKPVLFIHSEKDDFILANMTKALFEKKTGDKKLFLAVNGAHAQSFNENRKEYEEAIDDFLETFSL